MQRYYSGGNLFAGLFGNQQIVTIAKGEIGASDGQKYWSWYGFSSYQEWCACFVSWCGEQAGLIESGAMPRFSLCSDGMSWFQSQGKWQAAGSTPTAGSLVFFDWGGSGVPIPGVLPGKEDRSAPFLDRPAVSRNCYLSLHPELCFCSSTIWRKRPFRLIRSDGDPSSAT